MAVLALISCSPGTLSGTPFSEPVTESYPSANELAYFKTSRDWLNAWTDKMTVLVQSLSPEDDRPCSQLLLEPLQWDVPARYSGVHQYFLNACREYSTLLDIFYMGPSILEIPQSFIDAAMEAARRGDAELAKAAAELDRVISP